ncbi:hypothetical protein [Streptomyces sp. NPDC053755]|uniref:hypothetical protein n=1 Tax=Streptomyces sp. NPDC053755 TaxID=3155815 RepID=UPI00341311BB
MHSRRLAVPLALAALLIVTGCVAVPATPAPPIRRAGLAPAADRPPAPLPDRPLPTPAPPRETLADTGPDGHQAAGEGTGQAGDKRTTGRDTPPRAPGRAADTPEPRGRTALRPPRTAPAKKKPKPKRNRAVRPSTTTPRPPTADLRSLCRQAGPSGVVPPDIVRLCRDMYGP